MFVFDKRTADKLHKPRRKETISEMLRHGVRQLERCRHPRLLHVLHSVEETGDTLAFATDQSREINRRQVENVTGRMTVAAQRIVDMDAAGIDMQALSPAPTTAITESGRSAG